MIGRLIHTVKSNLTLYKHPSVDGYLLSGGGGADDPLVAVLHLQLRQLLQAQLLLRRALPAPPGQQEQTGRPHLGQHAQRRDRGYLHSQ